MTETIDKEFFVPALRTGINVLEAESTQLSTCGPSHKPNEGINCESARAQPTQATCSTVLVPRTGCSVTTLRDGESAEVKATSVSWSFANTSKAAMAGEGAEQEYDTKGMI